MPVYKGSLQYPKFSNKSHALSLNVLLLSKELIFFYFFMVVITKEREGEDYNRHCRFMNFCSGMISFNFYNFPELPTCPFVNVRHFENIL